MATLTAAQVYAAARNAGFPPDTARQMVAIAKRESSFNPGVLGTINAAKETSYGLWQINWKDAGIRTLLQRNGITDPAQLYDPTTNARAAYLLWGGNDRNLDTSWYINRTGSQYGYAEKYQTNLNALPPASDLEMLFAGGAGIGTKPAAAPTTLTLTQTGGGTYGYMPGAGGGGGGNSGSGGGSGGGGIDFSAFGVVPNGQNETASIAGLELSASTVVMLAVVGFGLWWFLDLD
jgi:uncharacterized membrane protein YgcG